MVCRAAPFGARPLLGWDWRLPRRLSGGAQSVASGRAFSPTTGWYGSSTFGPRLSFLNAPPKARGSARVFGTGRHRSSGSRSAPVRPFLCREPPRWYGRWDVALSGRQRGRGDLGNEDDRAERRFRSQVVVSLLGEREDLSSSATLHLTPGRLVPSAIDCRPDDQFFCPPGSTGGSFFFAGPGGSCRGRRHAYFPSHRPSMNLSTSAGRSRSSVKGPMLVLVARQMSFLDQLSAEAGPAPRPGSFLTRGRPSPLSQFF